MMACEVAQWLGCATVVWSTVTV